MAGMKSELGATAQAVAANIRRHRERIGWGYARLARELTKAGRDIPPLGLSRIEDCERRVDVDDLVALAVVFGISPITLLMPDSDNEDAPVEMTAVGAVQGKGAWLWLNGSYPLSGSVLAFYNHALPCWERTAMEGALGGQGRQFG